MNEVHKLDDPRPLAIDLYCGLGGWTEGLLAEGYEVVGFDNERHQYGDAKYPAQLVLQDVLTLHGSQFKDAALIVASPPCQEFSYMAMPWSRAKEKERRLLADPEDRKRLTALFDACFRIQREACEAAGHHIPMVVENVRGAQKWVGRAQGKFGSFYLWGDVPPSGSWFNVAHNTTSGKGQNPDGRKVPGISLTDVGFNVAAAQQYRKTVGHRNKRDGNGHTQHLTNPGERVARKDRPDYPYPPGDSRKAASAMTAKIPFELARHVAASWL